MSPNLIIPDDIASLWLDEMQPRPGLLRLLIYIYLPDNREYYMKLVTYSGISLRSTLNVCIGRYCPASLRDKNIRYTFAKVLVLDKAKNTYALRILNDEGKCCTAGIEDLDLLYLHIKNIP